MNKLYTLCFPRPTSKKSMLYFYKDISRNFRKRTFEHVRSAKIQISLCIRAVWSVFVVRMKKSCILSYPNMEILSRLLECAGWSEYPMVRFLTLQLLCSERRCLTHCSRETRKRVIGKQCRPRSDAAKRGVWSGSLLFANSLAIFL